MAGPEDAYLCREMKEASMERMPWEDWWSELQELAEEEAYKLGPPSWYRKHWAAGKSPETTLEELEEA